MATSIFVSNEPFSRCSIISCGSVARRPKRVRWSFELPSFVVSCLMINKQQSVFNKISRHIFVLHLFYTFVGVVYIYLPDDSFSFPFLHGKTSRRNLLSLPWAFLNSSEMILWTIFLFEDQQIAIQIQHKDINLYIICSARCVCVVYIHSWWFCSPFVQEY